MLSKRKQKSHGRFEECLHLKRETCYATSISGWEFLRGVEKLIVSAEQRKTFRFTSWFTRLNRLSNILHDTVKQFPFFFSKCYLTPEGSFREEFYETIDHLKRCERKSPTPQS